MALAVVADKETSSATHSPGRQALAEHCASIAALKAAAALSERPVARLRRELAAADARFRQAETNKAKLAADHAATIVQTAKDATAKPFPKPPPIESSQTWSEEDGLAKTALERALAECVAEMTAANGALREAEAKVDALLLDVLLEEHAQSLAQWQHARAAFVRAETSLSALQHAIAKRGRDLETKQAGAGTSWLRAWEALQATWQKQPVPEITPRDIHAASADWAAMLMRLAIDPTARVNDPVMPPAAA